MSWSDLHFFRAQWVVLLHTSRRSSREQQSLGGGGGDLINMPLGRGGTRGGWTQSLGAGTDSISHRSLAVYPECTQPVISALRSWGGGRSLRPLGSLSMPPTFLLDSD